MTGTVVVALVAVALAAGCGERAEPLADLPAQYPVTVEGAGDRPTVVGRAPERIVALDPGSADLLVALGVGRRLVGTAIDVRPAGGGLGAEVVGPTGQVDVDAVVRLDPDLIVARRSIDPTDVAQAAAKTGAALYMQPDESIEDVERAAIELGFLVGEPVAARRLVLAIEDDVARADAVVARLPRIRVFIDMGFLIPARERSLVADLVRRARGVPVGGGGPAGEPLEPCEVARLRPRLVLRALERTGPTPLFPSFRRCRGIAPPRVRAVPGELVTWPGPNVAEAFEAVARALHPDAFR